MSSSWLRAAGSRVQVSRKAAGVCRHEGVGADLAQVLFVHDLVDSGLELGSGAPDTAAGEGVGDLGQLAVDLGLSAT